MRNNPTETPALDTLFEELGRLQYAAKLLDEVYAHIGPYSGSISYTDEPWRKVRDFYGFDDSE